MKGGRIEPARSVRWEYRSRFTARTESNCEAAIHTVAHSIATAGGRVRSSAHDHLDTSAASRTNTPRRRFPPLMIKRLCVTTVPRGLSVPHQSVCTQCGNSDAARYARYALKRALLQRRGTPRVNPPSWEDSPDDTLNSRNSSDPKSVLVKTHESVCPSLDREDRIYVPRYFEN